MQPLLDLDTRLYLAVVESRNAVTVFAGLFLAAFVTAGLGWWGLALVGARARGLGRPGLAVVAATVLGGGGAWVGAELLKVIIARPRPFLVLPGPEALIRPVTYSFPSGDAALSFGAAVALGTLWPAIRPFALLLATAVCLGRVIVGAHYPSDVLGGAVLGAVVGTLAVRGWRVIEARALPWRVLVVAHTHSMAERLLARLEHEPDERVTLDAPVLALEEHLGASPADRPRVAALLRAGRLHAGPFYAKRDALLAGGELMVRDLQEGLRAAGELGRASRVAYAPDARGHPAQLPQILRGFGYETFVFSRGAGGDAEAIGNVFWWQAPSGDRVRAVHAARHHANPVRGVTPSLLHGAAVATSGDAVLLLAGDDGADGLERLPRAVAAMRTGRVDARLADLEQLGAVLGMPAASHAGELAAGRFGPILGGAGSARVWIRQEVDACERLLLERCEPLDALSGGTAATELRALWRLLLATTGAEPVDHQAVAERLRVVRTRAETLLRRLEELVTGAGTVPLVWSPVPWERRAVVDVAGTPRLVRCAALGVTPAVPVESSAVASPGSGIVENAHLRVEVGADGSFEVVDKASGARSGRLNELEDEGDRGDVHTFEFAGPLVRARGVRGAVATAVTGDRASVRVSFAWPLPVGLRPDRLARLPALVACPVTVTVTLDAEARHVDVAVTLDNHVRDHRLRAVCRTGARTATHVAGGPFEHADRVNAVPAAGGWVEPPAPDRCAHDLVAIADGTRGLALGLGALREYAVAADGGTIAITLVRAVGWLSRGDLRARRGHAGPALETPLAQCPGPREYRYAVVPFVRSRADLAAAARVLREAGSAPWLSRGAAVTRSLVEWRGAAGVDLTALRAGTEADTLVARVVNTGSAPAEGTLRLPREIVSARAVDLREGDPGLGATGLDVIRTSAPPTADGDLLALRLAPHEIGTYLVRLSPERATGRPPAG